MKVEQNEWDYKKAELFEADYRVKMLDLVANRQAIDRENLMLMRCIVVLFAMFLGVVLSGLTGFYN